MLFIICRLRYSFAIVDVLILFSSCCFSSSPDATLRSAICTSFVGFTGTSPAPLSNLALFLSFTHSVSTTLSLYACILTFPSRFSLKNRSVSFSTFTAVWFLSLFHAVPRTTSSVTVSLSASRQHVESSWLGFWNSFHHNPWQWRSSSVSVSCDFLSLSTSIQEPPLATACHTSRPSSSHPYVTFNGCAVQLLPRTNPLWVIHKTAPVRS